jgi:translation initiation factor 2B subunit (eIF-2B alpha/beta/delta family)
MISNTNQLQKSLTELKKEQARLGEAIRILEQLVSGAKSNRLSPEGRARISEAARKRWEEHRRKAAGRAAGRHGERHAA